MSETNADDSGVPEGRAAQIVRWIVERAVDGGVPGMTTAKALADEYRRDTRYKSDDERVDALINWEMAKNFTSGFVTNLGGLLTLPIAIPAALGASWVLQARMSAAIASIYGHDITSDRLKTFIVVALVGGSLKDLAKTAGIQIGQRFAQKALQQIPGRLLSEINKQVGTRLLTKAGSTGIIRFMTAVPLVGGFIGGGVDAAYCRAVGLSAKAIFAPNGEAGPPEESPPPDGDNEPPKPLPELSR